MAENSLIEWCHHTFNPWRGCTKVSPGCKFCYAEKLAGRNPAILGEWGLHGTRVVASESVWKQPLAWDRKAWEAGERHRVFCASLADVFEGEDTMPAESWPPVQLARQRLAALIRQTPNLEWLLLTKRPENAARMLAEMFGPDRETWPTNFRVGTSVENQEAADTRLPHLLSLKLPNFVSAEPLLGPVDFTRYLADFDLGHGSSWGNLHWIIVGGESGPDARPMHLNWVREIRNDCLKVKVPFLFKQWGEWTTIHNCYHLGRQIDAGKFPYGEWHGREPFKLGCICGSGHGTMVRVGKKAAGRNLDGVIHDEYPASQGVARG